MKHTELTWEDINTLERIINNVHYEFRNGIGEKSFGEEVLNRFLDTKDDASEKPNNHLEGLDWAAENYVQTLADRADENLRIDTTLETAFKAGAEWMANRGVTFTAPVDYDNGFYLDSSEQEEEAINKLGLKVMDWAVVQIRKKEE